VKAKVLKVRMIGADKKEHVAYANSFYQLLSTLETVVGLGEQLAGKRIVLTKVLQQPDESKLDMEYCFTDGTKYLTIMGDVEVIEVPDQQPAEKKRTAEELAFGDDVTSEAEQVYADLLSRLQSPKGPLH
jgi:hypothetical protein